MVSGFVLTENTAQEGVFNLNDREITYKILYNSDVDKYYLSLYEDDIMLIGGMFLSDGADILYNRRDLNLGKSLMFRGNSDLSGNCYLIYEV